MKKQLRKENYDVVIVGAGVTGTALAYVLSAMTSVKNVLVIEKGNAPGLVNSDAINNSQTLHTGDIETNYSLPKALSVKRKAEYLKDYVDSKHDPALSKECHKMVLGVGEKECALLEARYKEFKPHYEDLVLLDPVEIALREPALMNGRDFGDRVLALASESGRMVNYRRLSEVFLRDAESDNPELEVSFDTNVYEVFELGDGVILQTDRGNIEARFVMFASGAYSLYFAHRLGHGQKFTMLPIAGSYFQVDKGKKSLNGKVYRVQIEGIPFAAVHGDPDITDSGVTRFGPTTKPLPLMERHAYKTFFDFLKIYEGKTTLGVLSLLRVMITRHLIWYVIKNALYDVPFIGKRLFLREVRQIIPLLEARDLELRKGAGGIRPQLVDTEKLDLMMGDATLIEERAIFNTTPSPGASVCLGNAIEYARIIVKHLGHTIKEP